jgi:hypothetical protein
MTPEEKAKQMHEDLEKADKGRADKARADAEEAALTSEKLDRILDCMVALGKRMDAYDSVKADAAKADADKDEDEGDLEDPDKPKKLAADTRKDSAMVRADSDADLEEIEHFKTETGATRAIAADSVLPDIQAQADRAATAWGKDAVHPWDGGKIVAYRRRSAREHQKHSPTWKDVDLHTLSGQALRNATATIFADSIAASSSMESYGESLREVRLRDPISGQTRIEFYGSPSAWTNQFKSGPVRVVKFRTGPRYED